MTQSELTHQEYAHICYVVIFLVEVLSSGEKMVA